MWCLKQDGTEAISGFVALPCSNTKLLWQQAVCALPMEQGVFSSLGLKVKGNLSKNRNFCIPPPPHLYGLSNFIQEAESQEGRLNRLYLKIQRLSHTHPQNKSLFPTLVGMVLLNTEEQMGGDRLHTVLNQAPRTQGILRTEWKHITGKAGLGRR